MSPDFHSFWYWTWTPETWTSLETIKGTATNKHAKCTNLCMGVMMYVTYVCACTLALIITVNYLFFSMWQRASIKYQTSNDLTANSTGLVDTQYYGILNSIKCFTD